ncbi:hypothetical protein [Amycolatopsis panacis]|uniref:hypothetical protein n=1 Tax=Amycolatopsis panacis TaxID=2340917 RepID=UPI001F3991AA|nr:hypothetical protein [Amycolatopsis panacis]
MIFVALGLVAGSLAGSLGPFFATGQARRMIAALGGQQALTDAFLAAEFGVSGVLVSAFAIVLIGRLRTEEHAGRLAPLLAAPLSRRRLLSGSLVIVLAGTAIPLLLAGLGAGLVRGAREGDVGAELVRLSGASLVQLPAVWVLTGLALAVFGRAPRAGWFGWAALAAFLVLGEFGSLFHFPRWVWGISPYAHLPRLPGSAVPAGPLLWLAAVAVVLGGVGFAAFGRRDLTA